MTENPLAISTQIATPIQTALNSTASISANDAPNGSDFVDEEPYTIKCICDYSDDDGNTIYCETCDTWQHIECFYPGRVADASKAEFDHSCADCKPRPLDRRHATERQRSQRQDKASNDDKKTKRPPSKSHKKKSKPSDLQVNGHGDRDDPKNGSPHDHHPSSKKTKGHRSNQSISSQIKRSPPYTGRPSSHAHPPSPAKTPPDLPPHVQVHSYSKYFQSLYDHDETFEPSHTNSFASLPVTNSLSLWLHDSQKLREDAGVNDKEDVFQNLVVPVNMLKWPELRVERKDGTVNDEHLHWRYLITPAHLSQAGRIGELNGVVGFQKDYCNDDMNRWQETAHPRPFVFFHPRLPLFIDTRQEGSICRYVRRSCRANTVLETFIASGSEYHFWLISERPLAANEQITIAWDFRFPSHSRSRFLHLLNLGDEDGASFDVADITDEEYDHLSAMIHQVLSDHGGCACDLGSDCAFARFHRNYHGRSQTQMNGIKAKKGRKPKHNHVSPTSTGHATNSRAASEGQQEQYDEEDGRSASGSTRSKPHSRDLTPLSGNPEANGMSLELTDREKRKIAMVEDSFRKLDQGQPPRKKKRASDGATANLPATATTPQPTPKPRQKSTVSRMSISQPSLTSNGSRSRQYVDAGTSGHQSVSPFSGVSPTATGTPPGHPLSRRSSVPYRSRQTSAAPTPKSTYTDSSTQTDNVDNEWYSTCTESPTPKKTIVPLSKRLLKNRYKIRQEREAQQRSGVDVQNGATSPTVSMDVDAPTHEERSNAESPTDVRGRNASIASSSPSVDVSSTDVNMVDAPAIIKPPPPPWPNHSSTVAAGLTPTPTHKSPDLRVQLPAPPSFSMPNMSGNPPGSLTPSSSAGSFAQSPFGSLFPMAALNGAGPQPSPVKTTKKLTLSDYRARKKNLDSSGTKPSAGNSPTVTPAVLKIEEAKASGILEGSVIVDSPMVEKADPVTSAASTVDPTAGSSPKNNLASNQPNGSL
jgi:uncharacterized protein